MKKVIYTIVVMCLLMAHKSLAQTILLNEDFSGGVLPPGWSIDSAGVTPLKGWQFTGTPWVQPGNGFDSNYYYPRIESTSSLINLDCNLTTPFFNTTGINKVFLSYSELASFNNSNSYNYSMQKVELTTDSGFTWQELFTLENYRHPSKRGVFDITNEALGFPYVKVRFRYISRATVIGEWAIDSVVIADSIPCLSPPDTGIAVSDVGFACAGEQVKLKLDDLSRGIGQTYQWQHKSSNTGNVFVNIPGAVYDTVTHTQPVATYYQCLVTCGGLTDNSTVKFVSDTPNVGRFNSANYCLLCPTCTDTILLLPSYTGTIPNPIGGPGVVFQWQKTDSLFGVYSDIPGATNNYYVASLANHTTGTYFQCKQTCAATGYTRSISQWTWFYEMINPHPMCYCYPPTGSGCGFNGYHIANINITGTGLNYTDGCHDTLYAGVFYDNYSFLDPVLFPNATTTLKQGNTYTLNITQNNDQTQTCNLDFYIDYNQDIVFDSTEKVTAASLPHGLPYSINFTVPANSPSGQTGMRVRLRATGGLSYYTACEPLGGSTEDYIITIDSTVGVTEITKQLININAHPNPAKNHVTVNIQQQLSAASARLKVFDAYGKEVLEKEIGIHQNQIAIDVSKFNAGLYFVQLQNANAITACKFLKD